MPELGHAPGLAQEAVGLASGAGEAVGPRYLDGDSAVELRVPGLVDGGKRPAADRIEQFEPAEPSPALGGIPVGRGAVVGANGRPAAWTNDVAATRRRQFRRVLAVWAKNLHQDGSLDVRSRSGCSDPMHAGAGVNRYAA